MDQSGAMNEVVPGWVILLIIYVCMYVTQNGVLVREKNTLTTTETLAAKYQRFRCLPLHVGFDHEDELR